MSKSAAVGPERLWVARHAQSVANLAAAAADEQGAQRLVLQTRDMDSPLSPLPHYPDGSQIMQANGMSSSGRMWCWPFYL